MRELNPAVRRIGQIIIHSIMAVTLIFGKQPVQQRVIDMVHTGQRQPQAAQMQAKKESTLRQLMEQINVSWN